MPVHPSMTDFEIRSVLLFAALTLSAGNNLWAQAATAPKPGGCASSAMFAQADKHNDKQLGQEEAQAIPGLEEQFDKIDACADGTIFKEKFITASGPDRK